MTEMFKILGDEGRLEGQLPAGLGEEDFRRIYYLLNLTRAFDDQAHTLVRQGRISFYAGSRGHEAAQVGSGYCLHPEDWVFPSPHRELGVHLAKGATVFEIMSQSFGSDTDPTHGRQMPNHFGSRKLNIVPPSTAVGTRIPHAAGVGWAAHCKKDPMVAVAYFGDGATSMSEFHVGLNFAAVFKSQAVFFCINNMWAISTPLDRQMSVQTIAERAAGYGFPGVLVDGNDVLAVYEVMKQALERARAGLGPTLIEARVCRLCAHTSFDDDRRYRTAEEIEEGERKEPIGRFRRFLQLQGLWSETWEQEINAKIHELVDAETLQAEQAQSPAAETLLDHVYYEPIANSKEKAARPSHAIVEQDQ
jgi:2-oxoisovalerate dehydrogenase E1 component alpha subunit